MTRKIREVTENASPDKCGLPLTFRQDRALTAVQLLFAWSDMKPSRFIPVPPEMGSFDQESTLSFIDVDTLSYCRAYSGKKSKRVDKGALVALRKLACKKFYLAYPPSSQSVEPIVLSPILMVRQTGSRLGGYPTQLRIIVSPVLLHGVDDVEHRYVRKPTDLYARFDLALGPGRGKRPPQLPRLASWIALQRNIMVEVGSEKLAMQLRSGNVTDGHAKRFVKTVSDYLEVLKKAQIVRSFVAPSEATNEHWKIVRFPPPKSKA